MLEAAPGGTMFVFNSQTVNATSPTIILNYPDQKMVVKAFGTWNGASIILQTLAPDQSTWIVINDLTGSPITFTINTQINIEGFIQGEQFRAILSSAGGSTNLSLTLQEV